MHFLALDHSRKRHIWIIGTSISAANLATTGCPRGQSASSERIPSSYPRSNFYVPAGYRTADRVLFGTFYLAVPLSPRVCDRPASEANRTLFASGCDFAIPAKNPTKTRVRPDVGCVTQTEWLTFGQKRSANDATARAASHPSDVKRTIDIAIAGAQNVPGAGHRAAIPRAGAPAAGDAVRCGSHSGHQDPSMRAARERHVAAST